MASVDEMIGAILTDRGKSKLSACIAAGTSLPIAQVAIGSGLNNDYYVTDVTQSGLKSEVMRGAINALYADPSNPGWVIAELAIPSDKGGWTIREGMLLDSDGEVFAKAIIPATYKPILTASSRANKTVLVQIAIPVGAPAAVTFLVDSTSVYATQAYVSTAITSALVSAISTKLAPNGYLRLQGGYIKQWGQATIDASGYVDVTFPIAFMEGVYSWQGTAFIATDEVAIRCVGRDNVNNSNSKTGCRFTMRSWLGGRTSGGFSYIVIGK